MDSDMVMELQAFIAVAEACHRKQHPSYSWHVLDWMSYKMRCNYPLVREQDQVLPSNCCVML
jgi:hypothetical protein